MKDIYENLNRKFDEFRQKIPDEKRNYLLICCGVLSFIFLLFSDKSDERVIYKTQKNIDYTKGRVLNNSRNIFKSGKKNSTNKNI